MLFGLHRVDLSLPRVMGILNATPDSFSDGGQFYSHDALSLKKIVCKAEVMVGAGVDFLDVGGESTRPGAAPVSEEEELARVIPVIEALVQQFDVPVSIDTSNPAVIRAAADAGASLINDVRALGRDGALEAAVDTGLPVCLMHMQGSPATMQNAPQYDDVLDDVAAFFERRVQVVTAAGVKREQIILDPGFGFGKTLEHNLRLLNQLDSFDRFNLPVLVGTSRKTMVGQTLDKPVEQRLYGSLGTVAAAVMKGAKIIRVHDVAETVDVVRMCHAISREEKGAY